VPLDYLTELPDPVTGQRFRPTPESSSVTVDGQLYLFASDETRQRFERDVERYVVRYR